MDWLRAYEFTLMSEMEIEVLTWRPISVTFHFLSFSLLPGVLFPLATCSAVVQVTRGPCPWDHGHAKPWSSELPSREGMPSSEPWVCPSILQAGSALCCVSLKGVSAHINCHPQPAEQSEGCFPKALRPLLKWGVPRLAWVLFFSLTKKRSFREPSLNKNLLQSKEAAAVRIPGGYRQLRAQSGCSHCTHWEPTQGNSPATSGTAWHHGAQSAPTESFPWRCQAWISQETERFLTEGSSEFPSESPSSDPCWHTCTERAHLLSLHFSSIPEQVARPGSTGGSRHYLCNGRF